MATINRGPLPADNFSILANGWIRDKRLSWKARGLLLWLASHSAGFEVSLSRIEAASAKDGRESARSAIKELEAVGYLVRSVERDEGGRIKGASYQLVDACPDCSEPTNAQVTTKVGFSDVGESNGGQPDSGSPDVGEPVDIRRTNSNKTNDENTSGSSAELALVPAAGAVEAKPETAQSVVGAYVDWCKAEGNPVAPRVKGHLAKEVKQLLEAGFEVRVVKLGLAHWHEKGAHPSAVASFVQQAAHMAATGGVSATRTEARVQSAMDLAASYEAVGE